MAGMKIHHLLWTLLAIAMVAALSMLLFIGYLHLVEGELNLPSVGGEGRRSFMPGRTRNAYSFVSPTPRIAPLQF